MHVRNVGDILRCTGWPEKPRPAADVARIFNTLRLVCMIFDYFIRNVLLRASGHISQLHLHQLYKIKCFISIHILCVHRYAFETTSPLATKLRRSDVIEAKTDR